MPFQSYDELMDMTKKDPKMALMLVNRAKNSGKKVVDEDNPGYKTKKKNPDMSPRMSAVTRRMQKLQPSAPEDQTQEITNKRKSVGY